MTNEQTHRLFGFTGPELLHQPIEILVPESFRASHVIHRQAFSAVAKSAVDGRSPDVGRTAQGRQRVSCGDHAQSD